MSNQDCLLNDEESKQTLYDLFGQNFLDGDKPVDWSASTINASSIKEYIDDFVAPMLDTQKRLYAESVIGKRYPIEVGSKEYQETREELRAEQRARIK